MLEIIKKIVLDIILSELFITILAGVFIFIVSQYILEFILKPHLRFVKIKYKILNKLKFYSNIITAPLELEYFEENPLLQNEFIEKRRKQYQDNVNNYKKISDEIRTLSCELDEYYYSIPKLYRKLFIKDEVDKASTNLLVISNALFDNPNSGFDTIKHNSDKLEAIKKQLRLI